MKISHFLLMHMVSSAKDLFKLYIREIVKFHVLISIMFDCESKLNRGFGDVFINLLVVNSTSASYFICKSMDSSRGPFRFLKMCSKLAY